MSLPTSSPPSSYIAMLMILKCSGKVGRTEWERTAIKLCYKLRCGAFPAMTELQLRQGIVL